MGVGAFFRTEGQEVVDGAADIRTISTDYSSRIVVAGGGGGADGLAASTGGWEWWQSQ